MIGLTEYMELDAVELAARVQKGELHASELLEAAIARADAVNPALNAITIRMDELARRRAKGALSGPLAGVPFLLKDLYQDYAGVPATSGCLAYKRARYVPDRHSEIVERWLRAGLVPFGRTNTPEFGAKGITEPVAWGPTHNPWRLGFSPGGSSGGSAAAVAAGVVPCAGASDGGGSIRVPAAFTGLFGFKPGRGRTPSGPDVGEAIHGAAVNHVLTRTVRDSAALLDTTHGQELGSIVQLAPPVRPYLDEVGRDPGRLRIAFSTHSPIGTAVHPDAMAVVERAAKLLETLGHHVEPAAPEIDGHALARDFATVWFAQLGAQVERARNTVYAEDRDFELDTLVLNAVAQRRSSVTYARGYVGWLRHGRALASFLERYDLYLTPSIAQPPPRLGELTTPPLIERAIRAALPRGLARLAHLAERGLEKLTIESLKRIPYAQIANVTGVPAMTVPFGSFADGLPLGVQFLGPHGSEGRLFCLAGQLERAAPWRDRRPALAT